jgi:hypothetical protein
MKESLRRIPELGLVALTHLAPVPGLSLLLDKRLRRTARKATGFALLGAGALIAVPVALYVICKTSGKSTQTN